MLDARLLAAIAVAASMLWVLPASALEGDPEAGRIKAQACMGCHGIPDYKTMYPAYHVPKIGGQHAAYIKAALKAYAAGKRNHPTMHAQAESLSPQDIADIAAFLSQAPSAE